MKSKLMNFLFILVLVFSFTLQSGTDFNIRGLPIHVKEISKNVIKMWVGDYVSSTAVSAIKTDRGIVVIDTTECPILDIKFREIIKKRFGNNIKYLINTHEHGDHTSGNYLYLNSEIIAHEKCGEGMKKRQEDSGRLIKWHKEYIPKLKERVIKAEKKTKEYKRLKEEILVKEMILESLKNGIKLHLPTKTFKDHYSLNMGNMTFELYYAGGIHTSSDIFIFIPEEGLLFTGDVMADTWLTDTPGCLSSFGLKSDVTRDLPLLFKNWETLMAKKDKIKKYIPGHWNGTLSYQGFKDRYEYVKTLYTDTKNAVKEGKKLGDMFEHFNMKKKFPHLEGKPGFTHAFVHRGSIITMWMEESGQKSAADFLNKLIESKGLKPAIFKIWSLFKKKTDKFFFLEHLFNALGYRYINEKKIDHAIEIFKLNIKMNPGSFNVYDSLGETYLKIKKKNLALKFYNKALKLNPKNERIIKILEKIK